MQRKCVQKYFCCKRTLAIVTYMYVDQFSVQSSQRAIQARHSLHSIHAIWGQLALQRTWIIQYRSAGDVAMAYWSWFMWLFESTRIRNLYFFRKRNFCVQCLWHYGSHCLSSAAMTSCLAQRSVHTSALYVPQQPTRTCDRHAIGLLSFRF